MQFKVEYISRPKPSPFVMVRHLKAGSFEFGPNPALDGILIAEWASPPRSISPGGIPDLAVFLPTDSPRRFSQAKGTASGEADKLTCRKDRFWPKEALGPDLALRAVFGFL